MNEKEKKAIERMQEVRDKNIHTFVDELTIVLNLIEKQQNRIDELEKALVEVDFKYRNKIDKLKNKLKEDIKEDDRFPLETFRQSYAKKILNILEE